MSKRRTSSKPLLLVVSAPSGAGKTTVVHALLKKEKRLRKTISHTTRPPRPGERHGREYFFVDRTTFRRMIRTKGFVEWASVYGNYYGTSKQTIRKGITKRLDQVLVIEGKGAKAIRRLYPRDSVFVRLLPPSISELARRISRRGGMTKREIAKRLRVARAEIRGMRWYKYEVINDRVGKAVTRLRAIVKMERGRR